MTGPDLCALKTPPVVTAAYTAQSGRQTSERQELARVGCTAAPSVSAKLWHLRSGRPVARSTVKAGAGAPDLTEVRVLLPSRLTVKPRRKAKGAWVTTGGKRLPGSAFTLGDGDLRVTLPAGARTLTAKLSKGVLRAGRKLRTARNPKRLAVVVLVRDGDGPRPARTLRVRPRRR